MTAKPARARLFAILALLAVVDLVLAPFSSAVIQPAFAQDDDDGGDDDDAAGGDDDDAATSGAGQGDGTANPPRRDNRTPRTPAAPPAAPPAVTLPDQAPGEIVVTGLSDADLATILAEGFTLIETSLLLRNGPSLHRLQVPTDLSLTAARDRVRLRETGRNADFNHYYRAAQDITPAAAPAPCTHLNCPAITQIDWPLSRPPTCRATTPIGVIDTGVNLAHAGLATAQIDLTRLSGDTLPPSGDTHGTAIVSLLVGTQTRAPGLIPEAQIIAVDVFTRDAGDERADVTHLVRALDLLSQRGVRIANLSLAGPENQVLADMLSAVTANGMLIIAASGNAGPAAPPAWPAASDAVLAVTAVDAGDRIYRRAQRGPHLDLAAPGVDVWSAASVSGVKPRTGTSYAAPFATAAAAILMSHDPAMTPASAAATLRSLTRDLGAAGPDDIFGTGLLALTTLCDITQNSLE